MPTFILNKLVRDKIVADQIQSGQNPVYRTLTAKEHAQALAAKIVEEAQEIPVDNREEAIKELADVQQVLDDLQAVLGITPQEIATAQAARHDKVGGFKDALFVASVSPAEDNKWTAYYRTEPDRFTEVAE